MNLQVTEYDLLIIKNALSTRLESVNKSLDNVEYIIAVRKRQIAALPQAVADKVYSNELQDYQYKRDIIMEEVYQLENIIHEVNKAQLK